jgi:hypothetical protein
MSGERAVTNGSHYQSGKPKYPNETRSGLYAMFWTQRKVWLKMKVRCRKTTGKTSEPLLACGAAMCARGCGYDFRR